MYRLFQRFTPAFLRKLDHQLLVSRPGLWATRVHYLLFYWLMGAGLASLLLMLMPIQLNDVPRGEGSSIMLMIVSGISLLAWAVQLAHYQPWKQGESHWRLQALRDQGVYFLGVGLLLLLPLGFFAIHQLRVDLAVDDARLKADRQIFDTGLIVLQNSAEELLNQENLIDYKGKLQALQEYQVVAAEYGSNDLAYSLDLENILELHYKQTKPSKELRTIQELNYKVRNNFYALKRAERPVMKNTNDRLVMFGIWASLGLVLLLFVRSSWQTFLLSVVSGLGLLLVESMLVGIVLATGLVRADEEFVVFMLILNWLVLGGIAFLGEVKSSRQQQIRMIALSLFTVLTTIIPAISKELIAGGPDREALLLYIVSCGITFLLWNLFIQGRMLQLVVSPKKQ